MKNLCQKLIILDANVHIDNSVEEHLPAGVENAWITWKA